MPVTFMGLRMDQEWADIAIWEEFFKVYPIKTFVELGSGNGGMSIFLALQCFQHGVKFHTFDNNNWIDWGLPLPAALSLRHSFHFVDLFSDDGRDQVQKIIEVDAHPMAIFFDDGDKPREWKQFAPHAHPGDFLVVHDWGTEFLQKDLLDVPVERILTDMCDARRPGYQAMWFKRI